jgi:hypothetical protein
MFRTPLRSLGLMGLVVMVLMASAPVSAQERELKQLVYLTSEGDVFRASTPNLSRIHLHGDLTLASADFFRGTFRGVQEDLGWSDFAVKPTLAMTLELFKNWNMIRELNLTAGMETGFSRTDPFPRGELSSFNYWYMANPYVGLSARLVGGVLAGVTYTYYDSPNQALQTEGLGVFDELAFTLKYIAPDTLGWFEPSVKLGFPDGNDGVYIELSARPAFQFMLQQSPVTVSFPVILGIGLDDYYEGENVEAFLTAGVLGSMPLPLSPAQWGDWRLNAGLDFTFRDDALEDLHRFDDGGSVVTRALIGVSFMY